MNNIFLESADKTPAIDFNHLTGNLILSGRSIPENAAKVYEPLLFWVLEYVKNARSVTNLRLNLDYFNTATTIWIGKIIKALSGIQGDDRILIIHIYFNIEDFDDVDEIKDDVILFSNNIINNATLSVSYKVYGIDDEGNIIKESAVFI